MRKVTHLLFLLSFISALSIPVTASAAPAAEKKEWTFLVFLNGKNNLDSFGTLNMNQMEEIGSTDKVNIVVQWGSLKNGTTKRVFVTKDNDTKKVTSPVIEDMGKVDMGKYETLVDFVKWGASNYPAKKYFVNVWDHGSGWHSMGRRGGDNFPIFPSDISWDDQTGSFITTKQLGQAMNEASTYLGQKVDIYGSDACLMSMAEVADEMKDSVDVFLGSEEVEPGEGWPYAQFLKRWTAAPKSSAAEVSKMLTEEYVAAYSGGVYGNRDVTFSSFDMSKIGGLKTAVKNLGASLVKLDQADRKKVVSAAYDTQNFTYSDYGDLIDFINLVEKANIATLRDAGVLQGVRDAVKDFVIINMGTEEYARAHGVAIWLPSSKWTYDYYKTKYEELTFHQSTDWGNALGYLLKDGGKMRDYRRR